MTVAPIPEAVVAALACPVCRGSLALADRGGFVCEAGHAFDRARQGYVHLSKSPIRHPGDLVAMVEARERVLATGLFDVVTNALAAAVPVGVRIVADLGAGTGHHLAGVLTASAGEPVGIAVDTSKPALRRAARAHPRILAVAADLTGDLPVREHAVDAALVVFAPRNGPELARILRPGGVLVVVTPTPEHLREVVGPLGMLAVDPDKDDRLTAALDPWFSPTGSTRVRSNQPISRATAVDLAAMGPAGFHASSTELSDRARALPEELSITLAVTVNTFLRR